MRYHQFAGSIIGAALVVGALGSGPALAAPATPAEQRMIATVDAEQARTLALLERMVNQNSGSRNLEGVRKVRDIVSPEFTALGFAARWVPMEQTGRAGHLILTHQGAKGTKRLLLIGHLDTVFEPDSPFQTFALKGDKATGPGVADDKGGMAVMIAALRAMQAAGTLKDANIEVVLTGDEEDAGEPTTVARADLVAAGRRADAALDFEGLSREDGKDMGSIARRSSNSWTLTVTAKSGHSSAVFSPAMGDGAIYAAARIIAAIREEVPEPNLTLNVGLIAGGAEATLAPDAAHVAAAGKTNIVPAKAIARGDLRSLSPEQDRRAMERMRAIVARTWPGAQAAITFEEGYPPMAPTPGNQALLARLNGVNETLGLPAMAPLDPLKRGAGDISFVAADVDGLVGLGPASTGDHSPAETTDVPSIWRQAKRAALLMTRLSREKAVKPVGKK
ncbi:MULTISPECIES: M20/M25/M40 family metallo-hydrolase [unclassified Novosphingobium]|uniref:M20/M25/M40 family metallo-hydrolase n=1 Tax=unclassified Novosphingobium TaxID=2644732 RepID=UPI000F5F4ADF|nr:MULTISPECIES: M20/M25/M40 family metallo-hydrolase [unclassified Novosphingobium]MBF5090515.1 M20 family metallopeptidase [Novosphingobium sp. NBM11]RQW42966.1 M20 family peptidase [Novosphingobium sp. LASN5T]